MKPTTKKKMVEKFLGIKIVDPVAILWKLIDEENAKKDPDCWSINAWEIAIERIKKEEGTSE